MTGRGLILAAPASGSGKTLITAGLARHLCRLGLRVATAKVGPDFIDPTFHALATGIPSLNLDLWAMRPATLAALIGGLEAGADLVLCEGVMGLFDGTGPEGEIGSTAELARITGWPVVLIVDATGQGASAAALLRGFANHDASVPISGVIFNRTSSERHAALLGSAVARHLPSLARLGALPADPALRLPSRHLGLVPADEADVAEGVVQRCAAMIGKNIDIERLLALPRCSTVAAVVKTTPIPLLGRRIAVARDRAFCFAYPSLLEGWRRGGAELLFFSPLADEPPDRGADSVYLPGGYPELWAAQIESAEAFIAGLRRAAAEGKPVYGECGGYMVLGQSLIDGGGRHRRMAGLLPLVTSFAEPRRHLGYRRARPLVDTSLGPAGSYFRGHEFHYARVELEGTADRLWVATDPAGTELGCAGLRRGAAFGSFIHLIDAESPP
jgi:cobyrinic acid a,c-diamide synthase